MFSGTGDCQSIPQTLSACSPSPLCVDSRAIEHTVTSHPARRHHDIGFLVIAFIKFFNGLLLFAVGVGALSLINRDLTGLIAHWADVCQISDENQLLQDLLMKAGLVRTKHLAWVSIITFVYSTLMFTMGFGLWYETLWGEYLTVIVTASFIPYEVYHHITHVSVLSFTVLAVNSATVFYLIWRLARRPPKAG
jgi:uncharacterized membrane protein (DUF2068 family)